MLKFIQSLPQSRSFQHAVNTPSPTANSHLCSKFGEHSGHGPTQAGSSPGHEGHLPVKRSLRQHRGALHREVLGLGALTLLSTCCGG